MISTVILVNIHHLNKIKEKFSLWWEHLGFTFLTNFLYNTAVIAFIMFHITSL